MRVLSESSVNDDERLIYAFRCCLSRPPSDYELERLRLFLREQKESFRVDAQGARDVVATVAFPHGLDEATCAAWVAVSRLLMNLDEFVTRD